MEAAAARGRDRVVKLSALHAEIGSPLPAFDWHGRIEAHLAASGVPHVLLRPAFFMENLLMVAPGVAATADRRPTRRRPGRHGCGPRRGRECRGRADGRRRPPRGLRPHRTGRRHLRRRRRGDRAAIGRPVGFDDLTPEQAQPRFDGAGHPDWLARQLSGVFALIRAGGFDRVADGVVALTGRPATTAAAWALAYAPAFAGPMASMDV